MRRQISAQPFAHARRVHQHQHHRQRPAIVGPHGARCSLRHLAWRYPASRSIMPGRYRPQRPMVYNRRSQRSPRSETKCPGDRSAGRPESHRPVARAGRALLRPDAGRPRRRGDQGRAAAGRRDALLGPAVRPGGHLRLLRRHQPQQAHDRARPLQAGRPRRSAEAARARRRADRQLQDRHRWRNGASAADTLVEEIPAPGPCPRLGLRRRRPAGRLPGLRRHGAGLGRAWSRSTARRRAARCASACRWSICRPA